MNKKMNKDEAEAKAKEVHGYIENETYMTTEGDSFVLYFPGSATVIARFPFEPPQPKYVIGDWFKFSPQGGDPFIARLQGFNSEGRYPYRALSTWYCHAEPYELIDPAEHAELKGELSFLAGQQKKLATTVNTIRREDKENKIEHAKTKADYADLDKRHAGLCSDYAKLCVKAAEHAQDSAVLAELLPVCKNITEMVRNRWSMSEIVYTAKQLEELLK